MRNFRALGAPLPDPRASGGWGLCPQTAPPLRISGYAPALYAVAATSHCIRLFGSNELASLEKTPSAKDNFFVWF